MKKMSVKITRLREEEIDNVTIVTAAASAKNAVLITERREHTEQQDALDAEAIVTFLSACIPGSVYDEVKKILQSRS
jgi:hypothetical protein